jgi:hypothetical protein
LPVICVGLVNRFAPLYGARLYLHPKLLAHIPRRALNRTRAVHFVVGGLPHVLPMSAQPTHRPEGPR